jgi:ABC-2 type transport system permease protein
VGLVVTSLLAYIAISRLSPSYGEGLMKIAETRSRTPTKSRVRKQRELRNPLLRWWLHDPIELWSFRLAGAYMRRDRDTKLRLYPSLTIFIVFPLISLMDRHNGGFSAFVPLLTVWMMSMLPFQAMQTLQISQNHLAADIFAIAPLHSAAPVFHGVRKAMILYLLLPALVISGLLIGVLAPGGLLGLELALPGIVAIPVFSLAPGLMGDYLPLSRPATRGEQSSRNFGLTFVSMAVMGIVMGASYLAWTLEVLWYAIAAEVVLAVVLFYFLSRIINNRPLNRTYDDPFVSQARLDA